MRLVLIGDIHFYRLWVPPWLLLSKRILGQMNLWLNRRHQFDRTLLAPLVRHVRTIEPDMLLFSGDLTSTALPGEFDDVMKALSPIVDACPTVMVPGNHDRYTFTSARSRHFETSAGDSVPRQFPHFVRLPSPADRWHLLALDGAVPRFITSRGLAGADQLAQARKQIASLTDSDGLVVLCHYALRRPLGRGPMRWPHRLADAAEVEAMLADCPARILYVHGHVHEPWCWHRTESGLERATDVNAGAPCLRTAEYPCGHGFWQIDLPSDPREQVALHHHVPQLAQQTENKTVQWHTVYMS